jgi:CHAD domain-containing protein
MAYAFTHPGRSVQKELRRIVRRQIDDAIAAIDAHRPLDRSVHDLRKRCKKMRGVIRLVRPCFPDYAQENAAFRDAARSLSFLRDAAVSLATYDSVAEAHRGDMRRFAAIRRTLLARRKQAVQDKRAIAECLASFRAAMTAARARVDDWRLDADGFDALAGGLAKTYKRARAGMEAAETHGRAADFHEWRKRVKYHGYHARLLEPIWPLELKAHRKAADALNDLLGEHHDLAVFESMLRNEPKAFGKADIEGFATLLNERRDDLALAAFAIGRRLLAEPPKTLVGRWRDWWTIWHKEGVEQQAALAA